MRRRKNTRGCRNAILDQNGFPKWFHSVQQSPRGRSQISLLILNELTSISPKIKIKPLVFQVKPLFFWGVGRGGAGGGGRDKYKSMNQLKYSKCKKGSLGKILKIYPVGKCLSRVNHKKIKTTAKNFVLKHLVIYVSHSYSYSMTYKLF